MPMNDSAAVSRMAVPMPNVPCTINGDMALGKTCKKRIRAGLAPTVRAAITYSSSLTAKTLDRMLEDPEELESYDFAFIDADKIGYDAYYERTLKLIRPGGLITFDNMLQHGRVADESEQGDNTKAIRALNLKIQADQRVDSSMVTIGDGLLLVRKKDVR